MATPRRRSLLAPLLGFSLLVAAAACADEGDDFPGAPAAPSGGPDVDLPTDDQAGLTDAGADLVGDLPDQAPRYAVTAAVDPDTGQLEGTVRAGLPVGPADTANLRFFPALVDSSAQVDEVTVDGGPAPFELDSSLLAVELDGGHGGRVDLTASFSYQIPEIAASDPLGELDSALGEGLQPADIGLLGRSDGVVTLGHWFPVWIPDGLDAEPTPDGFGDIGNFPAAAVIEAEVDVPSDWTLVSGGVRLGEDGDRVVEGAAGLRDLGLVLMEEAETVERTVGSTTVRVLGTGDAAVLDEVADETVSSLETLSDRFGPYPWTELDVVATPLGSGVGGMEWPGMVWIEEGIFAGGVPGLGDLGELDDLGLGDLGELGDQLGLGEALDPEVLGATRAWTVAHEVGHQWWHAVVGNDSIISPTVDEPLAQYSACLVFQAAWPDTADQVCQANTAGGYEQMRLFGDEDAPAAQPTDAFTSSLQYGGVVYGKAPGVYKALAEEFGADAVDEALAGVVSDHAFEQISVDELQAALAERLGDAERVEAIWARWIEEAHGDEDLGIELGDFGDFGDLGDLEDLLEDL
jgi:hypothetical protein